MNKTALFAVASALTLALPAVASAAPTEVGHYAANGEYASYSTSDGDSYSYLSVYRGGTAQARTTYLNFYTSSCTYTDTSYSCSGTNGWGQIPNGDFDVHGNAGDADLVTDTSGLETYAYSYTCDNTTWTCSFSEGPGPSGLISVAWTKSREYKFTNEGRSESDYLNYRWVSQGRSTSRSASVEGDVLGKAIASAWGDVGTSRSMTLSITKNP